GRAGAADRKQSELTEIDIVGANGSRRPIGRRLPRFSSAFASASRRRPASPPEKSADNLLKTAAPLVRTRPEDQAEDRLPSGRRAMPGMQAAPLTLGRGEDDRSRGDSLEALEERLGRRAVGEKARVVAEIV